MRRKRGRVWVLVWRFILVFLSRGFVEGVDEDPDGFGDVAVEKGDADIAGILFEGEMIAEFFVKIFCGHTLLEAAMEFLDVGAGRDVLEKVFADDVFLFEVGKLGLVLVELQDGAIGAELDGAVRKGVQLGGLEGVNFGVQGAFEISFDGHGFLQGSQAMVSSL
jgi:hypothetical protein